jgi:hypothetical protein
VTIRLYPSRLPGEPLETHEHRDTSIHDWMLQHVDNYRNDMVQRVALRLTVNRSHRQNGRYVLSALKRCKSLPDPW